MHSSQTQNIMLCTLGASWAVVPEIYGFVNQESFPLYRHHPEIEKLKALRQEYHLQPVDEIWICTTQGQATENSISQLQQWSQRLPEAPVIRIWQAEQTNELANQAECRHIQELILRTVLKAHTFANGGQVVLSLAGGRKTMSADLQWAASVLGCQALLHVIGAEYKNMPEQLKNAEPQTFVGPLSKQACQAIMPLVTGQTRRSDLLDIEIDGRRVTPDNFPLPMPGSGKRSIWPEPSTWLSDEIRQREKAGSRLLGNYFFALSREETHENWRSLYRLSPRLIDKLRNTALGPQHESLLKKLPKADLHRHLGGSLDLAGQRRVGNAIWNTLNSGQQQQALEKVKPLLAAGQEKWPENWASDLKSQPDKAQLAAALLVHADDRMLQNNLWQVSEPRVALKTERGFKWYELPGDLSGSTVLSNSAAITATAECLIEQAQDEGLAYIELRGSPQKYGDGLTFLTQFYESLQAGLKSLPEETRPIFRFIIIVDRRNPEKLQDTIELALEAKEHWPDFIVGLDMAGDESQPLPENIHQDFSPVFEQCLPVTIHAGEGEEAKSIWTAAYTLHADRIGHGLSLHENPSLATRFRNRDICLELCPTSNVEVVGYRIPGRAETERYPEYPLMKLWKDGMPLTLCTDNPGISRTSLVNEYLTAATMMQGQLTLWDTLAMIKQGFIHGFLDIERKTKLLKQCDKRIYQQLLDETGL
jgi:adenosine deaminase